MRVGWVELAASLLVEGASPIEERDGIKINIKCLFRPPTTPDNAAESIYSPHA